MKSNRLNVKQILPLYKSSKENIKVKTVINKTKEEISCEQGYYNELQKIIKEIRGSDKKFHQKLIEIYTRCSIDFDPGSPKTKEFYGTIQNKLHWAITGHTAAELIAQRADAKKPNMGLTAWKNGPYEKITKSDIGIAKNYLRTYEIKGMQLLETMFLAFAEEQIVDHRPMTMKDWTGRLNKFLRFNGYKIYNNREKITMKKAKEIAMMEFKKFRLNYNSKIIDAFAVIELKRPVLEKYLTGHSRN